MAYGFETYRTDTSVNMNDLSVCGVFIELLDITSGSGSKSYPMIPAGELRLFNIGRPGHAISIDYDGSGYARVNWSIGGDVNTGTRLLIFARKLSDVSDYGMTVRTTTGQVIADYAYPVPQFAGTLTPPAAATASAQCPNGIRMHTHIVPSSLRPGTNRIVLINLPNNGADTWYAYDSFIPSNAQNPFNITLKIFAPDNAAYVVPTLHIFSLDGIISASNGYGIQLSRTDTSLVYDSGAENLTASDCLGIDYPAYAGTSTYNANLPTLSGVLVPAFSTTVYTSVSGGMQQDTYTGVMRRAGSQLQTKRVYEASIVSTNSAVAVQAPASLNTFCIVTDLAYLSSGSNSGTPGPIAPSTYPSYVTPPNIAVGAEDEIPQFSIGPSGTTAGTWHNGTGNPALYEVMVSRTGGTYTVPNSGYAAIDVWYSLDAEHIWGISAPAKAGVSRVATLTYQIRIKSNSQVVVNSGFSLEYARTF